MGTLLLVKNPPRSRCWKIEIDGRAFDSEESLLATVKNFLIGRAVYMKTNFGDKNSPSIVSFRKKHFDDGYWVYSFWFSSKKDAALCKLLVQ